MGDIGLELRIHLSEYRWRWRSLCLRRSLPEVIVPICTMIGLCLLGERGKTLRLRSLQSILAGLSHLLLDLSTGVLPLPLLYPNLEVFRLSFGLLPSAGKIQLTNYLFYRNIFIELGVLLPLSILVPFA